jgi:bifunctional non-homologous end joining protein LigD
MPRRDPLPDFIAPQLAMLVARAPEGDGWVHELKIDGYRVTARIERGQVRIFTRNANDWTPRLRPIATVLADLRSALPISTVRWTGAAANA